MYFLAVNGKALPVPAYYRVDNDDVDSADSKRSDETGMMHRRRLRNGVHTCEVKWILDGTAAKGLHTDLSEPVLSVSLLDPASAGYAQCDMYAKNLTSVFYQQQNASESKSWWELSCTLVEY